MMDDVHRDSTVYANLGTEKGGPVGAAENMLLGPVFLQFIDTHKLAS